MNFEMWWKMHQFQYINWWWMSFWSIRHFSFSCVVKKNAIRDVLGNCGCMNATIWCNQNFACSQFFLKKKKQNFRASLTLNQQKKMGCNDTWESIIFNFLPSRSTKQTKKERNNKCNVFASDQCLMETSRS